MEEQTTQVQQVGQTEEVKEQIQEVPQANLSLLDKEQQLVNEIIETDDMEQLKQLTNLFNVAQLKKNVIRILGLSSLSGAVEEEFKKRIEQRPNEFTTKELLDSIQILQNQLDKANQHVNTVDEKPLIQINQPTVTINNDNSTDAIGRNKIVSAVNALLTLMQQESVAEENDDNVVIVEEVTDTSNEEQEESLQDFNDDLINMLDDEE